MKTCSKCLLPETYETLEFDKNNSCNVCDGHEFKKKKIDWKKRKKQLDNVIKSFKGKHTYDCIIPFSGGKDSTFTLLYLMKEYSIKPLVVRFNHGFYRPLIEKNNQRTLKKLGVDFIDFTPNWKIVKLLMMETFNRKTDFCWHCHTGIYSYPVRMAKLFNVPLIIWGETQSEITSYYSYEENKIELEDEEKFNRIRTLGISSDDMYSILSDNYKDLDKRDFINYTFPSKEELKDLNLFSVALGNYIPWDYTKNTNLIKKELKWEVGEVEGVPKSINTNGEKTECFMQGSRDYIKFLKRGYGRATQINAFELRKKNKTYNQAQKENYKYDGKEPHSLKILLDYLGITKDEFYKTIKKQTVYPNKMQRSKTKSKKMEDFSEWYKENS